MTSFSVLLLFWTVLMCTYTGTQRSKTRSLSSSMSSSKAGKIAFYILLSLSSSQSSGFLSPERTERTLIKMNEGSSSTLSHLIPSFIQVKMAQQKDVAGLQLTLMVHVQNMTLLLYYRDWQLLPPAAARQYPNQFQEKMTNHRQHLMTVMATTTRKICKSVWTNFNCWKMNS